MVHFDPEKDLKVDLSGKVIFITGATAGIGFPTAQVLVNKGATVYIGARSEERAKAAIKRIEDESKGTHNGKAIYWPLELEDPHGVKKSAEEFMLKEKRLDVLINNAAFTMVDHNIDSNGVLNIMTVNYFSHVVLTETLFPLLKKTSEEPGSDVRIINVGSDAYKLAAKDARFKTKEDFAIDTGNGYFGTFKRYARTKLIVWLWTSEYQRHLTAEGSNIIVICAHPGGVLTENAIETTRRSPWPFSAMLAFLYRRAFTSVLNGAANSLVSAVAPHVRSGPDAERYKGAYTAPIGKIEMPTSGPATNEELAKELWETTHVLLKEWGLI